MLEPDEEQRLKLWQWHLWQLIPIQSPQSFRITDYSDYSVLEDKSKR